MNKKTLIFLFATIFAMALPSCKGDDKVKDEKAVDPWTEQMNHNLADLATRLDHLPYTTSMSVYNLSADSFLFNYHERQQMIPASTLKLLIAISALENLGIKGEFHTTLHQNGSISGGTLHGDLILVGGFDPLLSLGDLQAMARAVKNAGIQSVDGRLIGDVSMTDTLRMGNGWSWDDYPSPVTPYLTPLFFDHQRLRTKNWNMIANPYPGAVLVENFGTLDSTFAGFDAEGNFPNEMRVWDGENYAYYGWSGNSGSSLLENPDIDNKWIDTTELAVTDDKIEFGKAVWIKASSSGKITFSKP